MDVVTSYWAKPIPMRGFDWCAWIRDTDETGPFGWGATEQDAIDDLKDWLDE